ncbi:MAG: hypothetical protein CVV47_09900 [Spirochaetae bacterium HGW-Spirochaetae-3]|nr:MAG: hypothetical protein CVV47_09900 [Spirochaetae bacterium HGW-Spirochaetae-3]
MERIILGEREELLSKLIRFVSAVGLLAYLPGVIAGVVERLWAVVAVDTVAYAAVLAVAFSPRSSPNAKLTVLVLASLGTGAVVLVTTGPLGAGYIWFLAAVVLSALFGDGRVVATTIGLTAAIMTAWAAAILFGAEGHGATPFNVLIISGSLLLISLSLSMVIRKLLDDLSAALAQKVLLADDLAEELRRSIEVRGRLETNLGEKVVLLRELQHRVRNNMQAVLSLLSIDEGAGERGLSDAIRRIRAISVTNDVFLSDPDMGLVDSRALVRAIAQMAAEAERDEYCGIESIGDDAIELDQQTASIVAVLISDLVAGLVRVGGVPDVRVDGSGSYLRVRFRSRDAESGGRALAELYESVSGSRMAKGAKPDVMLELSEMPDGSGASIYLEAGGTVRPAAQGPGA